MATTLPKQQTLFSREELIQMRVGREIVTASQFEHLVAESAGEAYSKYLYSVKNQPGVWKRYARLSQSLKAKRPEAVLAFFDGQVIELLRDAKIEEELRAAGVEVCDKKDAELGVGWTDANGKKITEIEAANTKEASRQAVS